MKKVLNLYANIWWNRKLREDVEVTAIEWEQERADYYKKQFPNDTVIVTDAHEYLLNHYKEFDFIRASPPCPTHSDIRRCWVHAGQYDALYPDMQLYQEIILLRHFAPLETKRVVENVKPYYDLLIPGQLRWRHIFWSNFFIPEFYWKTEVVISWKNWVVGTEEVYWFCIKDTKIKNKRQCIRDLVHPELGLHIFNSAYTDYWIKPLF